MASASPFFDEYRATYPARQPDLQKQRFADEVTDLSSNGDIVFVETAPTNGMTLGKPQPTNVTDPAKYLWLVTPKELLGALEFGSSGRATARRRLAHTNLSGGKIAHAGGEMWFPGPSSVWMTGGSGRYPPATAIELEAIATAFAAAGYSVRSAGWDVEINRPARVFRGDDV